MIRILLLLALAFAAACNKPTDDDCRKAIVNMQTLLGTDKLNAGGDLEAAVRRCRGNTSKKAVQCAIEAQNLEGLKKCGLLPDDKPAP